MKNGFLLGLFVLMIMASQTLAEKVWLEKDGWVENPGEYTVHVWNIHQEADGDNDVWFAFNDAPRWKVWDHHVNEFTWSEFDAHTWELARGINTVHLIRRSKGFGIDRMVLHKANLDSTVWGDASESKIVTAESIGEPATPINLTVTAAAAMTTIRTNARARRRNG